MKNIMMLLTLALLTGCAFGNKISYDGTTEVNPNIAKDTPILILVHDIRPYILTGNKRPDFVGLTRSLAGIPYPTHTSSGAPLADDFAGLILNGMRLKGYSASTTHLASNASEGEIKTIIKEYTHESGAAMLFDVREWKTDSHFTTSQKWV